MELAHERAIEKDRDRVSAFGDWFSAPFICDDERITDLTDARDRDDPRLTAWEYDFIDSIETWTETRELTPAQDETVDKIWSKLFG